MIANIYRITWHIIYYKKAKIIDEAIFTCVFHFCLLCCQLSGAYFCPFAERHTLSSSGLQPALHIFSAP
jgi:hypothetical protein